MSLINIIGFAAGIIFLICYYTKLKDSKELDNKVWLLSLGILLVIIDLSHLLLWFAIYSSTEVLLLLNKQIKNSE